MPLVLIVDDEPVILESTAEYFRKTGYDVITAETGEKALDTVFKELPDVVLLDLRLPDVNGIEVLGRMKKDLPQIPVIMMTGYGEVPEAVEAIKLGAEHYLQKPLDLEEMSVILEKCVGVSRMREQLSLLTKAPLEGSPYPIFGASRHIMGLYHLIGLLADNADTTVLITGETGTGKELIAKNIHALSRRAAMPMVDINCASMPENILESELFGHEAGAFTDAKKTKKGLFEHADGGTVFLDEIGELPVGSQAKLLRVIEGRSLRRLGSNRDIRVDVRIIAATNRDLSADVAEGRFRDDLFYRINVMPVHIPPLRERPEDIEVIAEHLLKDMSSRMGKTGIRGFDEGAMASLLSYSWPGNVRELRNVIERALILANGQHIVNGDLLLPSNNNCRPDNLALKDSEKAHIERVIGLAGGNRTKAAEMLGIARSTLNEKIKLYNL